MLFMLLRKYAFKSVYVFLLLADIAGGFTVDAAVAISTLIFELHLDACLFGSSSERGGSDGLGTTYSCNLFYLAEPIFWLASGWAQRAAADGCAQRPTVVTCSAPSA